MATKTRNPYLDFDFSKFADFGKLSESFKVPGVDAGVMIVPRWSHTHPPSV